MSKKTTTVDGIQGNVKTNAAAEKAAAFVYVGPSLPKGRLKKGTIFRGTKAMVLKHLEPVISEYPEVQGLLVTSDKLGKARELLRIGGNFMSVTYDKLTNKFNNK